MNVVDLACRLISFDTAGPQENEQVLAEWIAGFLHGLNIGARVELQVVAPGRANLIARIGAGRGPGLLLSGHLDVVVAGELARWTVTRPFAPLVKEGKLYGRGACDMKGPDACILAALQKLRDEGVTEADFNRQLTLVFTAGEEMAGWFVSRVVGEKRITSADAQWGIVAEPTMLRIVRSHKAYALARLTFHGTAAHSSRPELGCNAIRAAGRFLRELERAQADFQAPRHPLLGSSTVAPTMIRGGAEPNIIPESCTMLLNFRLIPEQARREQLLCWLQGLLDACRAEDSSFDAEVELEALQPPLDLPADHPAVRTLTRLLGTEPEGVSYYTEAVDYTEAGIPTLVCGPGSIAQAHGPDEFIEIEQLHEAVDLFSRLIREVCLSPSSSPRLEARQPEGR